MTMMLGTGNWKLEAGSWKLAALTAALTIAGAAPAVAQVPQAAPAINAAKNARTQTELAQQKNAEALPPSPPAAPTVPPSPPGNPAATAGQPAAPAGQASAAGQAQPAAGPAGQGAAPLPPPGAGYTYDPAGRRDPFVSLNARGAELSLAAGQRPAGVPGLLIGEVTVKGIFKSPKGGFIALLQAPDGRTYPVKQTDKVFDGSVKAITPDAVVFSQDVNDPLSLVKQREVRKSIRPEAR